MPAEFALLEGSGSVIPPVRAQATVCVASAAQPAEYMVGYLGTYRMLLSDLLVLTMCEPPLADEPAYAAPDRAGSRGEPGAGRDTDSVPAAAGGADPPAASVAFFTTAPARTACRCSCGIWKRSTAPK